MPWPDTMYLGSDKRLETFSGRVFLTPHKGIASLFIVDTDDLAPYIGGYNCNLGYPAWHFPNDALQDPPSHVAIVHNIAESAGISGRGRAAGFLYAVDVRPVKYKQRLFVTSVPDREAVYKGGEPLLILSLIKHSLTWDIAFDPAEVKKHGLAVKFQPNGG